MEKVIDEEKGAIKISDEVVSTITGIAASKVKGVVTMGGGLADGIAEFLGKKSERGVRVEMGESEVKLHLAVVLEYGRNIPQVALEVQQQVKKAVEEMTGLRASVVNVSIQGVQVPGAGDQKEKGPNTFPKK